MKNSSPKEKFNSDGRIRPPAIAFGSGQRRAGISRVRSASERYSDTNGYLAVTAAIIISIIIFLVVFTLSTGSFLTRLDISTSAFKEESAALARACLQMALFKLSLNSSYSGGETIAVASDTCQIVSVATNGSQKVISTQGQYQNSFTNLKATVNAADFSTIGLEELPNF